MSLFDRIPPMKNAPLMSYTRSELMRRGGRGINLSHTMAAGNLVVLGEVDNAPLPFPLEVQGDRMTGEGTVYYQASLPMKNRSALIEPLLKAPTPQTHPTAVEAAAAPAGQTLPPTDQAVEQVVQ
jgi:hypothetical protein